MIGAIATWLIARNPAMTLSHARRLAKIGVGVVVAIVIGVAGLTIYMVGRGDGKAREQVKQAERTTKAVTQAREADDAARGAVDASKGAVEAENDRARDAAKDSADPLRDGLKELDR